MYEALLNFVKKQHHAENIEIDENFIYTFVAITNCKA